MSTTYIIQIGYLSGASTQISHDEAWKILKEYTARLSRQPQIIHDEAVKFGAPETCPCGCGATLMEHCEIYGEDHNPGIPLIIDDQRQQIVQLASGSRTMKEHVRRAFCRLLIYEMHRHGIEVNLTVG